MFFSSLSIQVKDIPVFKDNDFMKDGCKMYIGLEAKERILEMLQADAMVCCLYFIKLNKKRMFN